jgi:hypothetical protein
VCSRQHSACGVSWPIGLLAMLFGPQSRLSICSLWQLDPESRQHDSHCRNDSSTHAMLMICQPRLRLCCAALFRHATSVCRRLRVARASRWVMTSARVSTLPHTPCSTCCPSSWSATATTWAQRCANHQDAAAGLVAWYLLCCAVLCCAALGLRLLLYVSMLARYREPVQKISWLVAVQCLQSTPTGLLLLLAAV